MTANLALHDSSPSPLASFHPTMDKLPLKSRGRVLAVFVLRCSSFNSEEAIDKFSGRHSALGGSFEAVLFNEVPNVVYVQAGCVKHRQECPWNQE